jgi:hypothetical protein
VKWGEDGSGVHFLLSLVDQDDAAAVQRRLGIDAPNPRAHKMIGAPRLDAPRSAAMWMLEQDDPSTNSFVYHDMAVPDAVKRDIVRGVPFGSAAGPLRVVCERRHCYHREPPELLVGQDEVIDGLRRATSMSRARSATKAVRRDDWPVVAAADRAEPLPGYTRWALSVRIDCPPEVRAQFGSHPKFTHRQRKAGIVELRDFVEGWRPARSVLRTLHLGERLFPSRRPEVVAMLGPLVREELGGDLEAWAVLHQLLPTFTGTARELVRTCGAVARV